MDKAQRDRLRADLYALPGGAFSLETVGIARNELRQLLNAHSHTALKLLKG